MEEVFIIIQGKARIKVENKTAVLKKGDAVKIPIKKIHQMKNHIHRSISTLLNTTVLQMQVQIELNLLERIKMPIIIFSFDITCKLL